MISRKTGFFSAFLVMSLLSPLAQAQMMGKGKGGPGGMMPPGMQSQMKILHDPEVTLNVTETADGVTITWTSKNKEKVVALKELAQKMKAMHALQMKQVPPAPTK
jgi:hypothetical protein